MLIWTIQFFLRIAENLYIASDKVISTAYLESTEKYLWLEKAGKHYDPILNA